MASLTDRVLSPRRLVRLSSFGGALGTERWSVDAVVEGHLTPASDGVQRFGGVSVELDLLPLWSARCRIEERWLSEVAGVEMSAAAARLFECDLRAGVHLRIEQGLATTRGRSRTAITQPVSATFEVAEPETWRLLLDEWLQPLQVLIWVATGEVGRIDRMEVLVESPPEVRHPIRWRRLRAPVLQPDGRDEDDGVLSTDVLFFADELPDGFGAGFARWLQLWAEFGDAIGPLFARQRVRFVYSNDRFYSAASAIEASYRYHTGSGENLGAAAHQSRLDTLPTLC